MLARKGDPQPTSQQVIIYDFGVPASLRVIVAQLIGRAPGRFHPPPAAPSARRAPLGCVNACGQFLKGHIKKYVLHFFSGSAACNSAYGAVPVGSLQTGRHQCPFSPNINQITHRDGVQVAELLQHPLAHRRTSAGHLKPRPAKLGKGS